MRCNAMWCNVILLSGPLYILVLSGEKIWILHWCDAMRCDAIFAQKIFWVPNRWYVKRIILTAITIVVSPNLNPKKIVERETISCRTEIVPVGLKYSNRFLFNILVDKYIRRDQEGTYNKERAAELLNKKWWKFFAFLVFYISGAWIRLRISTWQL